MKVKRKVLIKLLLTTIITLVIASQALNASASLPALFELDTWTGEGSISANVGYKYTAFDKLSINSKDVDSSNYEVTGTAGNTVLTFKENYLKTLQNGSYYFSAVFCAEGLETYKHELSVSSNNEMLLPSIAGVKTRLVKLTYGDEEVDPINYDTIIETDKSVSKIIFKENYLETLSGDNSFWAHMSEDEIVVKIHLKVEKSGSSATTTEASHTDESDNVNTGYQPEMTSFFVIALLSLVGCAIVLLSTENRIKQ